MMRESWAHSSGFWRRSTRDEVEESTNEEENNDTETGGDLWLSLGGEDGIDLSEFNELENLLADETNGVILEGGLNIPGFLGLGLLLSLLGLLLNLLLNFECRLGEFLSIVD